MSADTFDDRVAALEEHLVPRSADDCLREAEEQLARGDEDLARHWLMLAKTKRRREEVDNDA